MSGLEIIDPGPLTTVQDLGRPGHAAVGIPESGALDPDALRLANRLVGNPETAAGLETTFGGLTFRARGRLTVAVTGAPGLLAVDGRPVRLGASVSVPSGAAVRLGAPAYGVRSLLAVRGGLDVPRLLGSASTDVLSGLGRPMQAGDQLTVGPEPVDPVPVVDEVPLTTPTAGDLQLRMLIGPRDDWFTPASVHLIKSAAWTVGTDSNRVGLRLSGPRLTRSVERELPSEGTVAGSLQVPSGGQPVLFLADHPVTGGYPVIAVVVTADLSLLAQARPGQRLRFRHTASP